MLVVALIDLLLALALFLALVFGQEEIAQVLVRCIACVIQAGGGGA